MLAHEEIANDSYVKGTLRLVEEFYKANTQIKESHGLPHILAVYHHALQAVKYAASATPKDAREIVIAALLHDVDDEKYFSHGGMLNATEILSKVEVTYQSAERIVAMIEWVSCSKNGNSVPEHVQETGKYYLLIPRWCDRLEAVGQKGVSRCYQYSKEHENDLSSDKSPRPTTEEEVWVFADKKRFEEYQTRRGSSDDMISHYYDKLLHVAKPPQNIVQNEYLEKQAHDSVAPLVEVCLRFGRTGVVDEEYLQSLAQ
eukprot:CAMPEP_0198147414 /NCGR_PEP_ID=MMETSP1443-20131203/35529_1 /TAXON_ID=186043 /ORGANISM="Entomoneis sp., Strain CCMP2396" /LENGTH=257 /DNA_ID=CAMNT_0043811743 /DNA_START=8 /DNA_END=781 /DNA_ORIENTATION=-